MPLRERWRGEAECEGRQQSHRATEPAVAQAWHGLERRAFQGTLSRAVRSPPPSRIADIVLLAVLLRTSRPPLF